MAVLSRNDSGSNVDGDFAGWPAVEETGYMVRVGIIAISKNEGRYLKEWIAYHLSIGISMIIIYNNESSDGTDLLIKSCNSARVRQVFWPSVERYSPQRSAYADGIGRMIDFDWIFFIDIDEFIVPFGYRDLLEFVCCIPNHVSAVALNWKTFGSSGHSSSCYDLVTETFVRCGKESWPHNCHFKTVARPKAIGEMRIHHPHLVEGDLADSNFEPFEMPLEGRTTKVAYNGIQLNHYQVKTQLEFRERMLRGNANFPRGHPQHSREATIARFDALDMNEVEDHRIAGFIPDMKKLIRALWHA